MSSKYELTTQLQSQAAVADAPSYVKNMISNNQEQDSISFFLTQAS